MLRTVVVTTELNRGQLNIFSGELKKNAGELILKFS